MPIMIARTTTAIRPMDTRKRMKRFVWPSATLSMVAKAYLSPEHYERSPAGVTGSYALTLKFEEVSIPLATPRLWLG
jgi:hypothetical protein